MDVLAPRRPSAARRPPTRRAGRSSVDVVGSSFVVGVLAFAVFCVWAAKDAGYAPTTWYPGGLFLLGLLVVLALAHTSSLTAMPRATAAAAALLLAFAAWSVASIAWSSAKGVAWDGANRTLLYAAVFLLFASLRRQRISAVVWLIGFGAVVAAIGTVDVARAAFGDDPSRFFLNGRLAAPAGYPNAACALFVFAAWAPAYLAARREVPPLVRGASLAVACVLGELAVVTQSRASLVVIPVAVLVYLALVPFRVRALLPLVALAIALTLTVDRLVAPYVPLTHGRDAAPALRAVVWTLVVSFLLVLAGWSLVALVDRRVAFSRRVVMIAQTALALLLVSAVAVGIALVVVSSPRARVTHAWRDFKSGYPTPTRSSTHFSSGLGNNRYDFWRVALNEFRRHPLNGVGADNFAEDYVAERRSHEEPLYPHSLELRVVAQTGVVGALLFAGFLGAVAAGARRTFRGRGAVDGTLRAGVAAAVYVGLHGSIDWFWEFPALTAPAIAALALATAGDAPARVDRPRRRKRTAAAAAVVVAAAATACSFALPWIADRLEQRAATTWPRDARAAFRDLDRARRLNPLSPDPDLLAGAIASKRGELRTMRDAFRNALARDPRQWYARLELGIAEAGRGRRAAALRELNAARRLDPREPVVRMVERRIRVRARIDRAAVDRIFIERYRSRAGR
jgi:O-antigen ligase